MSEYEQKRIYMGAPQVGLSISNHLQDAEKAKGSEKMRWLHKSHATSCYRDMNGKSMKRLKEKLQQRLWYRDIAREAEKRPL